MSILHRVGTTQEEREAYLRSPGGATMRAPRALTPERYAEIADKEQFILTVTENGYGKRTSAYEYRRTNRGGQGITNIDTSQRNGCVVASFPARQGEQLMLITDQGKMIRTSVGDIRIMSRSTQGVTIFRVSDNEHVVSVARIDESEEEEVEVEGDHETAPDEGATVGESELDKPADPGGGVRRHPARGLPICNEKAVRQPAASCAAARSPRRRSDQEEKSMPLPNNALVLVADGRKMLFFRNQGDENQIDLRTEAHDQREDRKDSDIKTDAPGGTHKAPATAARPTRKPTSTSRKKTAGSRKPPTSSTSAR